MITEDYVSFEVAKLLKEKGFNEPCKLYYDKYHGYIPIFVEDSKLTEYGYKELVRNDQNSISDFIASAPSLYVAMKWLREVHNIHIVIKIIIRTYGDTEYYYELYGTKNKSLCVVCDIYKGESWGSSEEACEAAIKYCLEHLI